MLKIFFDSFILKYPRAILLFLLPLFLYCGFLASHLQIDASSKSLLMDNDPDLAFLNKINKDFYNPDILLVTFRPNDPLLSKQSLESIKNLSNDFLKIPNVSSVTSILNAPLLENKNLPVSDLVDNIPTLESKDVNITLAKKEFLSSPLYKNSLVSSDFTTTALVINLKSGKSKNLLPRHEYLKQIRKYLSNYQDKGKLFLGGVDMIADDMIGFVKNDIFMYGSTLTILLIIILWTIFRELKMVYIPMLISILSIVTTTAIIVLFNWKVTVISSNFVSLQLIITLSIILHLVVRYRELARTEPDFSQKKLVLETVVSKAKPSFYAIATTVVGFASLALSGIKPVIYLGLMMSLGISISLIISFIMFGALMMLHKKSIVKNRSKNKKFSFIHHIITIVERKQKTVFVITALLVIFSITGIPKLIVENSFINYFKSTTEIYKSLKTIDQKLGGTTPFDVIITLKKNKKDTQKISTPPNDAFDEFDEEFSEDQNDPKYWFTPSKTNLVEKVHDYLSNSQYIGNTQSLATLLKLGRIIKHGKNLDNFELALLYEKLPEKFKKILLSPYINIQQNELRIATRIKDSDRTLRRNSFIKKIKRDLSKIIDPKLATFRVGNMMILYNNMLQSLFKSQILTLGVTLLALYIMFIILFQSIKVATIAMTTNIIPIGVIFAVMGWGGIPLDMMTITIAAISVGIGVDDTIHYIHRYKEEFEKDKNYIKSLRRSHESIGYAMYYTSLAIIIGFSLLITSNFIPTIYFGLLTVIVMAVALLCALILLPILLLKFKPFS